ncbi:AraC family transcriptional regulator [Achromobacter marplatensis]|uniref:helix-turn-helix domain-containing protein n=1 Tax=Achromobacter marplatensis TaxID=470868 RepID=UPI0028EC581D|nr:AraC family transcriptional regulator [Achromobacter marplatensis]
MPSLRAAAEHHRVDAALSQPGGVALHAGVFRRNATRWRDEPLHRGLKVIMLDGDVHSRIEDRTALRLQGPTLFLAWNTGQAQGADAFEAGVDQQYAMVSLPDTALWSELGLEPDFFKGLAPGQPSSEPIVWHGAAGRDARRIADQVRVCAFDGAARRLYLAAKGLELAAVALAQATRTAALSAEPAHAAARELDAAHEARRRLLADLRQPPGASELARDFGLHTRKLEQAFKRAFGLSMARCVQEARLVRGRDLILNGGMSVSEAAWHVGYAPAHFSVAFRRRFNASPSALR